MEIGDEECLNKGIKRKALGDTNICLPSRLSDDHANGFTACASSSMEHEHGYRIVSLPEWLHGSTTGGATNHSSLPLPLVDLRTPQDFEQRRLSLASIRTNASSSNPNHIANVPIVNLPLATLLTGERSCELPPRHVEFAILVPHIYSLPFTSHDSAAPASSCIHEFFFATQSKTTYQSRKPWLVRQVLIEDEQNFWNQADRLNLLLVQNQENHTAPDLNRTSFHKMDRLWKPDTLVSSDILPLLKTWLHNNHPATRSRAVKQGMERIHGEEHELLQKPTGMVVDLGSGAGRDICFLAEELKQFHYSIISTRQNQSQLAKTSFPIQFIGIDNHKGSSKRCLPLWKNRGVEDVTQSIHLDLNKLNGVRDLLNSTISSQSLHCHGHDIKPVLCIFAIRYLNRRLFSYLARSASNHSIHNQDGTKPNSIEIQKQKGQQSEPLTPPWIFLPKGTIIAISHFCKPHPNASWNFDHPKESHVLERWELKDMFQSVVLSNGGTAAAAADDDVCTTEEVKCWMILKDDICLDGDHGRTLIQFVVVKVV